MAKENLRVKGRKLHHSKARPGQNNNLMDKTGIGGNQFLDDAFPYGVWGGNPPKDPMAFYNWYMKNPHLWSKYMHPSQSEGDLMGFICTLACNMLIVIYCDCKSDDNWLK